MIWWLFFIHYSTSRSQMKSFVMINSQSCSCKRKGFVYRSSKPKRGLLLLFSIFPTLYAIKTKAQGLQRETNSLFLFKANDDELFWQNNAVDYQWRSKRAARSWREHTHIDACMNINKPVNKHTARDKHANPHVQKKGTDEHIFRKPRKHEHTCSADMMRRMNIGSERELIC